MDEIRDAYLAYLLDPLSFKYRKVITKRNRFRNLLKRRRRWISLQRRFLASGHEVPDQGDR